MDNTTLSREGMQDVPLLVVDRDRKQKALVRAKLEKLVRSTSVRKAQLKNRRVEPREVCLKPLSSIPLAASLQKATIQAAVMSSALIEPMTRSRFAVYAHW